MKSTKNTFILGVIFLIVGILLFQIYSAYTGNKTDTRSYLTLIQGNGMLNEAVLETDTSYVLSSGDTIKTGEDSLAVVAWGDGSLTRLGENTKIIIEQNQISRDYSTIHISFDLLSGKTWSNIVSFLGEGSSFTQKFNDIEAGVRGTVFAVDLDKNYVSAVDHSVTLTNTSGEILTLLEGKALNISQFRLYDIQEFLKNIQDTAWTQLNEKYDAEYLEKLRQGLLHSIEDSNPFLVILELFSPKYKLVYLLDSSDDYSKAEKLITKMSEKNRKKSYTFVLTKYQNMHFIKAGDSEYIRKLMYKRALIDLAPTSEKIPLVQSSIYDLEDALGSENISAFQDTMSLISDQADIAKNLDFSSLVEEFDVLPQGLKQEFASSFVMLGNIFQIQLPSFEGIDISKLSESAKNILNSTDSKIQNFLDSKLGDYIESFQQ